MPERPWKSAWPLVPAFLLAQALLVHWAVGGERLPQAPVLKRFPSTVGAWNRLRDDPIAPDVIQVLHADQLLSRTYVGKDGTIVGLLVTWFASQRSGLSQPHSPKVCLPASGWTPEITDRIELATSAGPITVNRYIVASRSSRQAILYWYQTPRRVIAGELAAKLWLVADAVRDHRSDAALVRVAAVAGPNGAQKATETSSAFAREVYPLLRELLPR